MCKVATLAADYQMNVSTALALASSRAIELRYDILARLSEMCRVEVKRLLKEAGEARQARIVARWEEMVARREEMMARHKEEGTVPVATPLAAIPKTNQEATIPTKEEGEQARAKIARVPTNEIIVAKKRKGGQQSMQTGTKAVSNGGEGPEASESAVGALVAEKPAGAGDT